MPSTDRWRPTFGYHVAYLLGETRMRVFIAGRERKPFFATYDHVDGVWQPVGDQRPAWYPTVQHAAFDVEHMNRSSLGAHELVIIDSNSFEPVHAVIA